MHRDHKLGLALGVLVVGFAAALCFPKQTGVDQHLLQLENTAELDADIAQLPVHAYTSADLPAAAPIPAEEPAAAAPASVFGPIPLVDGGGEFDLLAGPPAPISAAPPAALALETGELDHEVPAASAPVIAEADGFADPPAAGHYVVQPGDTLSSVAAIHLGNQSRYVELFEANREILATPDDLRPGMLLVIPGVVSGNELILPQGAPLVTDISGAAGDAVTEGAPVEIAPAGGERPRLFSPVRSQSFLKTQPVSRESTVRLPTMDATENAPGGSTASVEPEEYTVRPGDTLEAIAVRTYGDARRVDELLKANRATVRDPRRLRPGMKLTLPAAP